MSYLLLSKSPLLLLSRRFGSNHKSTLSKHSGSLRTTKSHDWFQKNGLSAANISSDIEFRDQENIILNSNLIIIYATVNIIIIIIVISQAWLGKISVPVIIILGHHHFHILLYVSLLHIHHFSYIILKRCMHHSRVCILIQCLFQSHTGLNHCTCIHCIGVHYLIIAWIM